MSDEYNITDYNDKPITIGTRVRYFEFEEGHPEFPEARAKYEGVVTEIGEFDGDVDDDTMRSIVIYPDVTVRFDSGDSESYTTGDWEFRLVGDGDYPEQVPMGGTVEELTVIG